MNVPAWAASYVGLRFADLGRDRDGVDCWGLARLIWRDQAGLDVPSFASTYERAADGAAVAASIVAYGKNSGDWLEVARGRERLFDAVLMRSHYEVQAGGVTSVETAEMHIGVVLGPGWLIHVEEGIDAALGAYIRHRRISSRVVEFWRHRELADD